MDTKGAQATPEDFEELNDEFEDYEEKFISENGATYKGATDGSGRKHGRGMQKWPDGSTYVGEWRRGKSHGVGEFWHANGDHFEGDFVNDKA